MRRTTPAIALLVLATAAPTAAQTTGLDALGFMAGCWRSSPDARGTTIEEHYTTPSSNLMLGMTRYLRDGASRSFEFTRIERAETGIVLTPHPGGVASVGFALARVDEGEAVFENARHDFPQRIRYRREGEALVARIEDLTGQGQEWSMTPCRQGAPRDRPAAIP